MAYTMEQYQKDHFVRKFPEFINDAKIKDRILQTFLNSPTSDDILAWFATGSRSSIDKLLSFFSVKEIMSRFSPGERLEGLSSNEVVPRFSPDERLEGLSPDERLEGLSPDERLEGLSPDEIQAYLEKIK